MGEIVTAHGVGGFRSIRARMLFWVLAVTVPIYATALYMSYHAAAQRLEAGAARDADELAARLVAGLDTVIRPIEGGIRTVAHQLEEIDPPRAEYAPRIHGILAAWPDVYGSTIAAEVAMGEGRSQPFAPYYFRREGGIAYSDLALESYAYRELDWYRRAADSRRATWSSPYFDEGGGNTWMVTYSVPFFRQSPANERELAGVVTADLALDWVGRSAERVSLGYGAVGWLVSPPARQSFAVPIGESRSRLPAQGGAAAESRLRARAERMLVEGKSFELLRNGLANRPTYLSVRHLESLDWRLVLAVPRAELLSAARHLLERQLWLGAAGLLLLFAAIGFIAAGVSRPIHALAAAVGDAQEGNLDFQLPATTSRDETGVLTDALRRLRDSLKTHVHLRAESLAAEARLEHELQIAASIQQAMLPRQDVAVPAVVQVAAALVPARKVGGDLYDFFALRDGSLLFAVGDVSDKGIPAALFMARVSGLLRELGNAGLAPDRLLSRINGPLAEGNDACMFVTLGCGILDAESGRLRYASAGHDPPLLRKLGGEVVELAVETGPAIGIEQSVDYRMAEISIAPGDTLILFTDGVTEAVTREGAPLGVEGLGKLLRLCQDPAASAFVSCVTEAVAAQAAQFHAEDDLTVLAVVLRPGSVHATADASGEHWRFVPGSTADVRCMQRRLAGILESRGYGQAVIGEVELIAEELLTNILRAGGSAVAIGLRCSLTPRGIELEFSDDGPAFDPLAHAAPDIDADIAQRSVGGLGIHLVRELSDEAHYARVDGRNILHVHLRRLPATPGETA